MSQPQQMNMGGMGGPVGGAPPQQQQQQQNVGTPSNGSGVNANDSAETVKRLNTYIYDYFLRNQHYDIARAMINASSMELLTQPKQSPSQRQNQPNGIDDMDTDRPKDLPEPGLQNTEGPFLQDWWFQFWDIYNSRRNKPSQQTTVGYLAAQRAGQKQRGNMMGGGMDPGAMQNMRQMSMMSNGMMSNDLKKAAMQNAGATNMTPQQQMAQVQRMRAAQGQQQMMQGQQMERSNSQMDMNGPRSGSPGSGDAPSPKRQRMDGNVQQMGPRPGQQGQMPNTQVGLDTSSLDPAAANQTRELLVRSGIDVNSMPVEQFNLIAMQPTNYQQKSAEQYSQQMQQSAMVAMNQAKSNMNKGMPPNVSAPMGPAGAQGSPLSQAGMDPTLDFGPNGGMRPGMVPGAAGAVAAGAPGGPNSGNHALQDYQMQLMLLEQQNKKRLLMARQEQDSMSSHPGMPPGPNGQFAPNMSPQGSRAGGPSPNPNEMARGTPKMQPGASPNGHMQGRVSPAPGFDPSQGIPPNMRNQMVMGPNGQMMPRSHPQYPGVQAQLTQGQLEMFNRANMMPNGTFPGGGQPMPPNMMPGGPPMQGQQQPGQGPPNMTPRQGNQAMPPPPAPQPNATGATQPSSPAPAAAPPTPNQSNKPKPGAKKDNKSAKKAAATKKGGQTGATPASESEQPPTPTPATPITPMNPNSFQNKQQIAPNGMPNGAQQQQPQHQQQQNQNSNGVQQPPSDMGGPFGGSGNLVDEGGFGLNMDFADVSAGGGDVLDNFDFDSFLNTDDGGMGFDFPSFDGGLEAGGDGMGGQ